jgi:hypothetical protein
MLKNNRTILHVVPDSLTQPEHFYLGSTKDIRGRTEYFNDRQYIYNELMVKNRSDDFLLDVLKKTDLSAYDLIFYEFALFPRSMSYVRRKHPAVKQVVRSINADFYHFLTTFMPR